MPSRALLLGFAVLAACAPSPTTTDSGVVVANTSYLRDIQPLVERSCAGCHSEGGVAPFALDTPEKAVPMAGAMWNAIDTGRMPPFYASADCNSYQDDERLTADEKATFEAWVTEGAPMGDGADERHAEVKPQPSIRRDTVMGMAAPFDARAMDGSLDNYRCFVVDPKATVDQQVSGYEVIPGNVALLHHLLAYAIAPDQLAELQALDDASPGEGYDCLAGGIGVRGAIQNQIAGWVPGAAASKMPAGTALTLKAGSKIVMQVHYNLDAVSRGASPMDQTQLALELAPSGGLMSAQILPMLKYNLDIKAGDAASSQVSELALPVFQGATVYRLMGHMHQLGTRVKLEVTRKDGSSQCLLDIPKWDFNWQRDYTLKQPYTLQTGDRLRITCNYDNSALNQSYVGGVQQVPRDVTWGESSLDEMCMTYMTFTR